MAVFLKEVDNGIQFEPKVGDTFIGRYLVNVPNAGERKVVDIVRLEVEGFENNRVVTRLQGLVEDDKKPPMVKETYSYRFKIREFRSGRAGVYTLFTPEGQDLTQPPTIREELALLQR